MIFDASLKKLRKLFVNPIGFFRDSWFFNSKNKAEELLSPLKIKSKNIFIISNLGQLKKAESFVQKFSKRSNYLIVLATEKEADLIILDESLGRFHAKHAGLKVTGTIGILLKAKQLGHIYLGTPIV